MTRYSLVFLIIGIPLTPFHILYILFLSSIVVTSEKRERGQDFGVTPPGCLMSWASYADLSLGVYCSGQGGRAATDHLEEECA